MSASDYPNGTAPHSALTLWGGIWVDPERVPELEFVKAYCEQRGVSFKGNQGYRWLGVPSDANVGDEGDTSDGTANQWYVKGVERRGGASAATPGYSNHGLGLSVDVASDGPNWQAVRDEAFRLVGWDRDVAGESWHYTKKRPATVDLSAYQGGSSTTEGDDEMAKLVLVEIPLDPKTGAQIGDGNPATNQKHVFMVNPENHTFWHVVSPEQLAPWRAVGIPFYESQGNGWIQEFRLLKPGESA